MHIGVDAHVLFGKFQGSRTYLVNLYKAILEKDSLNSYTFLGHWGEEKPFGDKVQYLNYPSVSRFKRLTYQTAPLIKRNKIELLHCNYISPVLLPCKSLLTVHDVLYETHPQYFDWAQVLRNKILIRHSVSVAHQIHTVSEYSRQSLMRLYGIPDELIKVVPNGVDLKIFGPENKLESIERVRNKFNVNDYILSVGRLEPRKNHVGLLQAYANVKERLPDIGPLVIVGQRDFRYADFFEMLAALDLNQSVRILDSVADDLLPDIYRASKLFVYPSFAEGFGIPPLEAMASGIPVISSNTTALEEVIQDGGILVDPTDVNAIAGAMYSVLTDDDLSDALSCRGILQARKWSWENSAVSYLGAISELYE